MSPLKDQSCVAPTVDKGAELVIASRENKLREFAWQGVGLRILTIFADTCVCMSHTDDQ